MELMEHLCLGPTVPWTLESLLPEVEDELPNKVKLTKPYTLDL